MNRFIAAVAVLLCTACGGADTLPPAGGSNTVSRGVQAGCPDAADPKVDYLSQDPLTCAAALFQCAAGETTFNDACGCGCIGPATPVCPSVTDPNVHYISQDPLGCAAALFQCSANQTTFNDSCGCGCID